MNEYDVDVVVLDIVLPLEFVNEYVKLPKPPPLFIITSTCPLLPQFELVVLTLVTEKLLGVISVVDCMKLHSPASCTKTVKLPELKPVNV